MTESSSPQKPVNPKLARQKKLWIIIPLALVLLFVLLLGGRAVKKKILQRTDASTKTEKLNLTQQGL